MNAYNDRGRIDRFITKSFRFRPDETFHSVEVYDQYEEFLSLAASGDKIEFLNCGERIGLLVNKAESFVLRVFREQETKDFWLFPVGDPGPELNGTIVSDRNTLQSFHVRDEYTVFIPASAGLHPMEANLQLTYPDGRCEFVLQEEISQSPQQVQCGEKGRIGVRSLRDSSDEVSLEITLANFENMPGKILFRQGKYARMLPVRRKSAVVSLPKLQAEKVQMYLYE